MLLNHSIQLAHSFVFKILRFHTNKKLTIHDYLKFDIQYCEHNTT